MFLLFWPCMIVALILSPIALAKRRPKLLEISSILILPLSLYLAATPRFLIWGLLFPLFYIGAAKALAKNMMWLALLLIMPYLILIGWLAIVVLTQ